jgi:hypothetical protein
MQQHLFFFVFNDVRDAASNSVYYGYPELWILRYPAHRYHAVPLTLVHPILGDSIVPALAHILDVCRLNPYRLFVFRPAPSVTKFSGFSIFHFK